MKNAHLDPVDVDVLRILADTGTNRWYSVTRLEERLEGRYARRQLLHSIGHLRRHGLVAPFYSGFRQSWSITTTGETALAAAVQLRLA